MILYFDLFFILILAYYTFRFLQVLIRMKETPIFPSSREEMVSIRKGPEKTLAEPTYAGQKTAIIIYSILLLFVMTLFLIKLFSQALSWSAYLMLFLLMAQNSNHFNLFIILKDGILSDDRFIAWEKIKSYKFVRIDLNHRFYGFSKDVNDTHELQIKTGLLSTSCIVMTDEVKEKLEAILTSHVTQKE